MYIVMRSHCNRFLENSVMSRIHLYSRYAHKSTVKWGDGGGEVQPNSAWDPLRVKIYFNRNNEIIIRVVSQALHTHTCPHEGDDNAILRLLRLKSMLIKHTTTFN